MTTARGWSDDEFEARVNELIKLIRKVWADIADTFAHAFRSSSSIAMMNVTPASSQWNTALSGDVLGFIRDVYVDGARIIVDALDGPDEVLIGDDLVLDYLQTARNRLVNVGDETWERIVAEISAGQSAGESIDEIADRIQATGGITPERAQVIARTEVHAAQESGSYAQAYFVDPSAMKEWLATNDSRTRPTHHAANGQRVAIGSSFTVGTSQLRYPGDPLGGPSETIQCRCTTIYDFGDIVSSEMSDASMGALVAAGKDWDPSEHPRGNDGKFIPKGVVTDFLKSKSPTIPQLSGALNGMTTQQWSKLTDSQKKYFKDSVAKLPKQSDLAKKLGTDILMFESLDNLAKTGKITSGKKSSSPNAPATPTTSPLGGDVPAGLKGKPGDPAKVTTGVIWGKHDPGTTVLSTANGTEQVVWNGKKYDSVVNGKVVESWSKKDAYANLKNDTHWVVPGVAKKSDAGTSSTTGESTPSPSVSPFGKPSSKSTVPTKTPPPANKAIDDIEAFAEKVKASAGSLQPNDVVAVSHSGNMRIVKGGTSGKLNSLQKINSDGSWQHVMYADDDDLKHMMADQAVTWYDQLPSPANVGTPSMTPKPADLSGLIGDDASLKNFYMQELASGDITFGEAAHLAELLTADDFKTLGAANVNKIYDALSGSDVNIDAQQSAVTKLNNLEKKLAQQAAPSTPSSVTTQKYPAGTAITGELWDDLHTNSLGLNGNVSIAHNPATGDSLYFEDGKYALYDGVDNLLADWSAAEYEDVEFADWIQMTLDMQGIPPGFVSDIDMVVTGAPAAPTAPSAPTTPSTPPISTPDPIIGDAPTSAAWQKIETDFSSPDSGFATVAEHPNGHKIMAIDGKISFIMADGSSATSWNPDGGFSLEQWVDISSNYAGILPENFKIITTTATKSPTIKPSAGDPNKPSIKTKLPDGSPNVTNLPTTDADNAAAQAAAIPQFIKTTFKDVFKKNKVGYWSKPEAIWDSIKEIQQQYKNPDNPGQSAFSPLAIIKSLDGMLKTKEPNPYETKMAKWAASAKGQAYINKSGGAWKHSPTPTPAPASVAPTFSPAAPGAISFAATDISHIASTTKSKIYSDYKNIPQTYLDSPAKNIYSAAVQISEKYGLSPADVLTTIDEVGAQKFKVANASLFIKKISDWLQTPQGAAIYSGVPMPKPATPALASPSFDNLLPEFNKSSLSTYDVLPVNQANAFAESMFAAHGALTPAQIKGVHTYTTGAYGSINGYLRGDIDTVSKSHATAITNAQAAMRPSTKPILLHRGTGYVGIGDAKNHDDLVKMMGQTWKGSAFYSTSVGGSAAFGGPVLIEIEAPAGTPMVWAKPHSAYTSENEMLLAAGLHYKLISVKKVGGKSVIRARVVPAPVGETTA